MSTDLLDLFNDIVRLEIELWNAVERRLRDEHDVALSWFEVMNVVERSEAVTVKHLTRELIITVGGASKLVDRIESAGYLRRVPHPSDGRSSILKLTPRGTRLLGGLRTTVAHELERLFNKTLPNQTVQQLANDLRSLRSALPVERVAKLGRCP